METVLKLKLPWTLLRDKLVAQDEGGNILYMSCLEGYQFNSAVPQVSGMVFSDIILYTVYFPCLYLYFFYYILYYIIYTFNRVNTAEEH